MENRLVRPRTVMEFQQMSGYIYDNANKRYSDLELTARLFEEIAVVQEIARKDDLEKMPSQLANVYSWWNALASRAGIDLQAALWHKYPNVCSWCLRDKNCICAIEHPSILEPISKTRSSRVASNFPASARRGEEAVPRGTTRKPQRGGAGK